MLAYTFGLMLIPGEVLPTKAMNIAPPPQLTNNNDSTLSFIVLRGYLLNIPRILSSDNNMDRHCLG